MSLHPLQRRILVEELVRRRAPEEGRRYAASQRSGRIDPNPHQLDAVVFALRRIPEGGCILADEVGLGKTIEAGLIISQLMAEGTRRVLLIVPKSLVGQWRVELYDLFGIDTREVVADPEALRGEGVFIVHREFAGGQKGAPLLWSADPFELVVIDEAHELFGGVHKRYAKDGSYNDESPHAQTAGRVRELVRRHGAPVLLLTATPIQNTLSELWSLVQYVEPTNSLLGPLPVFKELFCEGGDRDVQPDQVFELRRRLSYVLQRTLRSQAQEFLEVPFVQRRARLVPYEMSPDERSLYDDVSDWLLSPDLLAFSGYNGRLLLLGFLRRMGSSLPAFCASLQRVEQRIEALFADGKAPTIESILGSFAEDLEDDEPESLSGDTDQAEPNSAEPQQKSRLHQELDAVRAFIARAQSLPLESKAECLINTVQEIRAAGTSELSSGKVVIFTESLTTQDHLVDVLVAKGVPLEEITLFRGQNKGERAREALARWWESVGDKMPEQTRPTPDVAMRLALVHEFRERSSVFISTEAGAKGLNLQFCERLINYDLPWNPQKIEQRIGRVHRYGQSRPVTVINFLASDNEAQALLFEILSKKLELFGNVLDASDAVLHEARVASPESLVSALGTGLQRTLSDIWGGSQSMDEVNSRLRQLNSDLDGKREAFDEQQARTAAIIEDSLDQNVRRVFKQYQDQLSSDLAELDRDLNEIFCGYLAARGVEFERTEESERTLYSIHSNSALPDGFRDGARVCTGRPDEQGEWAVLHLGHPLVRAAVSEARGAMNSTDLVGFAAPSGDWPELLRPLVGQRGRAALVRVGYYGLEPVDRLLWVAVPGGADDALPQDVVTKLLEQRIYSVSEVDAPRECDPDLFDDLVEETVMIDQEEISRREELRYDKTMRQLDRYLADQVMVLKRRQDHLRIEADKRERRREKETNTQRRRSLEREAATLSQEAANLEGRIQKLSVGEDRDYRDWVARLQDRRFKRPKVECLLEFNFYVGEQADASC